METIKKYFVDNINRHLIGVVILGVLMIIFKPTFGGFLVTLTGYFVTDIVIHNVLIPLYKNGNFDNPKLGTILQNIVNTVDSKIDHNDITFGIVDEDVFEKHKKSKFHQRMESLANARNEIDENWMDSIKSELREDAYQKPMSRQTDDSEDIFEAVRRKVERASNKMEITNKSSITVNGKHFKGGNNISIINGVVKVDGRLATDVSKSKNVNVILQGDTNDVTIETTAKCYVNGTVHGDIKAHNLECGNVGGNIKAHNVTARDVQGSIKAHNITTL